MNHKVILVWAALGMAVPASLPAAAQTGPGAKETITVATGGKTIIAYLPLPLAYQLGYFKDEGLEVDIQDLQNGPKAVEALVGGSADMVYGAIDYAFLLQPKGVNIVSVFLGADLSGIVLGLPPEKAKAYRGPAELKGLKIGVTGPGGAAENMLRIILNKGGLSLADVTSIGVGSGATAVAAMETGKVDAMVQADPVITRLAVDGFLLPAPEDDTRTLAGQTFVYGGPAALAGATTTAEYARAHRDAVQHYVNALVRAVKWLHTAPVGQIVNAMPPEFYGGDKDIYTKVIEANKAIFTDDGRATKPEQLIAYRQVLDTGRLAPSVKIDMGRIFNSEFVDHAEK